MTAKASAEKVRCAWPGLEHPEYIAYHDTEWGVPTGDSQKLFEKLVLEGFQSGLSWLTILRKRENFRKAFANFEPDIVAALFTTMTICSSLPRSNATCRRWAAVAFLPLCSLTTEY